MGMYLTMVDEYLKMSALLHHDNPNVEIGDHTYGTPHIAMWTDKYKVRIGRYCSISGDVQIIVDGNHNTRYVSTYPFSDVLPGFKPEFKQTHKNGKGDITIGNAVWLGAQSKIMPGVTIGDGAVIGAFSVVTKPVGDYEVVAGNPARHIRFLFSDDEIRMLKKIAWWNWPVEKIRENQDLLQSDNVSEFIRKHSVF